MSEPNAFSRGGSGSSSDADTISSPAKYECPILIKFFKLVARPSEDYLHFRQEFEVKNIFLRRVYELSSKDIGKPELRVLAEVCFCHDGRNRASELAALRVNFDEASDGERIFHAGTEPGCTPNFFSCNDLPEESIASRNVSSTRVAFPS